jgi:BirA family transcriptional regulator, biotin operon repressor / biotin---[acetyl-CoA-carboxylase] ligase
MTLFLMKNLIKLIHLLNDGKFYPCASLATMLNLSPATISRLLQKLVDYDIRLELVESKGYRLNQPLVLLDAQIIKQLLNKPFVRVITLEKISSTNNYLKNLPAHPTKPTVCLAEMQVQGKGRFNRTWHSPFGQNLYFSLRYPFQQAISKLSGLSLIVALATCRAIEQACAVPKPLSIKWPNDILFAQQKLGGILIEIQAESPEFCQVIIGIGINVNMQHASAEQISQNWTSLSQLCQTYMDRNRLSAHLINELLYYLPRFAAEGLSAFIPEWLERDCLLNQPVRLLCNDTPVMGTAVGINSMGHLILQLANQQQRAFAAGEATLIK